MKRQTVAAVIPTKNVARFIRGALDSLWFCDEIIVVDMHSTDGTRAICEQYPNVRFFEREDYIYGNFNFGMDQARSEWIIRLDSDERISPALRLEIEDALRNPTHDVYTARMECYFLGKVLRHGPVWEQPARTTLFRKGALRYQVRSEHEDFSVVPGWNPRMKQFQAPYVHFSTPSIRKFVEKMNYYTGKDLERARPDELKTRTPLELSALIARRFFRQYVRSRGYLDGYHGFAIAALNAVYGVVHELKAWEHREGIRALHDHVRDAYDAELARLNPNRPREAAGARRAAG